MKKQIITLLIVLFFMPILVNAETITYNICKSGCEYSDVEDVTNEINAFSTQKDVNIVFHDSEDYNGQLFINENKTKNINVEGNGSYIYVFRAAATESITVNNIRISHLMVFSNYPNYDDENFDFTFYLNNREYRKGIVKINNVTFIDVEEQGAIEGDFSQLLIHYANATLTNINFANTYLFSTLADITINNSNITGYLLSGISGMGAAYGSRIYIDYKNNNIISPLIRRKTTFEEYNASNYHTEFLNGMTKNTYAELELPDEFKNSLSEMNVTEDLSNIICFKQEVSKIIKANTSISEFESEFVNTYKDSIGYDDIKDLPIEWNSEDESIAKLENGVIIPVSAGNVDLVGKRGNDIYIIHLTVEKETIPEKIDKMTIKVPITGNKIKAWVVVISVLLLGVVGMCGYMLIKRKK